MPLGKRFFLDPSECQRSAVSNDDVINSDVIGIVQEDNALRLLHFTSLDVQETRSDR